MDSLKAHKAFTARVLRERVVTDRYEGPPAPGRPRAGIVARVSTARQAANGWSLGTQLEDCRQWCHDKGWDVVVEHYGWESASRDTLEERPLLLRVLEDIDKRAIDAVVCLSLDRLFRSTDVSDIFRDRLDRVGAGLRWVEEEQSREFTREMLALLGRSQ